MDIFYVFSVKASRVKKREYAKGKGECKEENKIGNERRGRGKDRRAKVREERTEAKKGEEYEGLGGTRESIAIVMATMASTSPYSGRLPLFR